MSNSFTDGPGSTARSEDKKCRICGFADTKNVHIFSANNKTLLAKILTVYPIVLYPNDPLPKNICKKCIYSVGLMYNDVQRVLKTQSKWINNVRSNQPSHNYIRVMDLIEHTNNVTRVSIKTTLGEDISQESINHLLLLQKTETTTPTECKSGVAGIKTSNSSNMQRDMEVDDTESSSKLKDIQSILELNGCSLLAVDAKNSKKCNQSDTSVSTKVEEITVKLEPFYDFNASASSSSTAIKSADKNNVKRSRSASAMPHGEFPTPPPLTVKCRYCPLQFQSLAALASHQLIHMRLHVKIFEKKYLSKKVRRGRLITVHDRKCIRCLNCWRVFVDNKSILDHWSLGECDFYCHICGKEFAQAPKMLREHVPFAHGVSYRSSKVQRISFTTKMQLAMQQSPLEENPDYRLYKAVSEQEPLPCEEASVTPTNTPKTHQAQQSTHSCSAQSRTTATASSRKTSKVQYSNGRVVCHICFRSFQNIKACNSHMRTHKPSHMYGGVVLPPNASNDHYTKVENERDGKDETETATTISKDSSSSQISAHPAQSNGLHNEQKLPENTTSNITTTVNSNVIRGIRTKFVSRRSDLGSINVKSTTDFQCNTHEPAAAVTAAPTSIVNTNLVTVYKTEPISDFVIKDEPVEVEDFLIQPVNVNNKNDCV